MDNTEHLIKFGLVKPVNSNVLEKYNTFLQEIGTDLSTSIREWILHTELNENDCVFLAAFAYQNSRDFL